MGAGLSGPGLVMYIAADATPGPVANPERTAEKNLPPKQPPPAEIRAMFSQIAPAYDFLNHLLSLGLDILWRRRAARCLPCRGRRRALDLCGGTGDFAWQLHARLPEASVIVADFARPMLERARQKFFPRRQILFTECDALALPFPDEAFDVASCAFGLRNLADLETGLDELRRVLKPGGDLLVLEFMQRRGGLFQRLFRVYFRVVLPALGRLVSGHRIAYGYLPASVDGFVTGEEFSRLLARRGFQLRQRRELAFGVCTLYHATRGHATRGHAARGHAARGHATRDPAIRGLS